MNKKILLLVILLSSLAVSAQYTNVINSNRPGFSESPYSVGSGVYQFESSLFFRKTEATLLFSNPQSFGLNLSFRTGFINEKLEFNVNTTLQNDKIAFKNIFETSEMQTGLSQFTLGAKYLVYIPKYTDKGPEIRSWKKRHSFDWKRWIPHIGVYAGLNFGSLLTNEHQRGGISPKIGVLLQNELSNEFNIITNLYYDYIGTDYSQFSYVITSTYNVSNFWSVFAEMQSQFESSEDKTNIGGGLAFLYNENLQFNGSLRALFERDNAGVYASLGVSYRLDRHRDKFSEIDEFGNTIEEPEALEYTENKGFFGRLFDKIGSIFKKKDKGVELDISKEEKEINEQSLEEKPRRTRQKSLVDLIVKEDTKDKKKVTKEEKKAAKKAKKKAEKEQRKLEKDKAKAAKKLEKDKAKEAKRLEKERLQLEKDAENEALRKAKEKEKERLKLEKEIKKLEKEIEKEDQENKKEDGN